MINTMTTYKTHQMKLVYRGKKICQQDLQI